MDHRENLLHLLAELRNILKLNSEKTAIDKATALLLIEKAKAVLNSLFYTPGNTEAADLLEMVSNQLDEAAIDIVSNKIIYGVKNACRALSTFLEHKEILYKEKKEDL